MSAGPLCPDPRFWRPSLITLDHRRIVLHLEPLRRAAACPTCGTKSQRVHSRYTRRAWDLPWAKWPVQVIVRARRFFCDVPQCSQRIFAERFPGTLPPYARRTVRVDRLLLELAHASSAEMAARVAKLLGFVISPDTLLRLQRAEGFSFPPPYALGVDEFAYRRGYTYGTILVDLDRHRPTGFLEDQRAERLADWLRAHPTVTVLARDRDEAYALAGRMAAPRALQVADRFHLVRNVGDALKELLRSRRWSPPEPAPLPDPPSLPQAPKEGPRQYPPTPRKQALWEAAQQRKDSGQSMVAIARELGVDRKTVRKYMASDHPPAYGPRPPRITKLTPYLPYLRQRWAGGCHNARRLYHELLPQGYKGSERQVKAAVHPWRSAPSPSPPRPPPSLHRLALPPYRRLTPSEREELQRILEANPPLAQGYRLKERFRQLLALRDVAALDLWIEEATASGLPTFQAVARGFHRDYEAVRAAFTTPWSTAQCEGQINRLKLIKRLGYGRAKPDLLRQRVLHRTAA